MTSLMIRAVTNAVHNAYEYVYEYEVMNMHFIHEYPHFAVVMQNAFPCNVPDQDNRCKSKI